MITAKELYEIAAKMKEEIISDALKGAKEHVIKRRMEEAKSGKLEYIFYVKSIYTCWADELLWELAEMVNDFESAGDYVCIYDEKIGNKTNFIVTFSWDSKPFSLSKRSGLISREMVYCTDYGIIKNELEE